MSNLQESTAKMRGNLVSLQGGNLSQYKLPSNLCTVQSVIPKEVQAMIKAQFQSVGLNFDVSGLLLAKDNKAQVKDLRDTVELIKRSKELLPMIKQSLVSAMKAAKSQAEFDRDIAIESLRVQAGIDKAQADVLIALAGYAKKRTAQELRLEHAVKRLEKSQQAMHW